MLKLLGSTAAASFVAACVPAAPGGAPGAAAPAPEGAAAAGLQFPATDKRFAGKTLNITLVAEPKPEALKEYVAQYQEFSGATVNLETLPYPTLQEKQFTELTQQSGASDIVHVDCVWMGQYAGQGWLHPVEEYTNASDPAVLDLPDFHPNVLAEQCMWEEQLYGLPFIDAVHTLYYRPDLFEKYGVTKVPETWEELRDTAQLIKEAGAADGVAGVTFMGKRGVQLLCNWVGMLGAFGGDWYTEDYVSTLDSPEAIASLEYFTSLVPFANDGVLSQDYDECAQTFADGKAAMNLQWQNAAPWFADPARSQIVDKWAITLQPGVAQADGTIKRSPCFGGWNMGISADSQNKELAWDFILWATTKEMEKALASAQPPSRMSVLSDPELQAQFVEYPTMLASLDVAMGRPRIAPWPQMADLIEGALSEAMTGAKTPEEALTTVNAQLNDILKEAGLQS
jgi:multiple sugar transport system substrate-binding protein